MLVCSLQLLRTAALLTSTDSDDESSGAPVASVTETESARVIALRAEISDVCASAPHWAGKHTLACAYFRTSHTRARAADGMRACGVRLDEFVGGGSLHRSEQYDGGIVLFYGCRR
jgi:hypothetical protein